MTSSLDHSLSKFNINPVEGDHKIRLKYIKNQFQQGKSVFKGYQTFCKKFGDDEMKYKDFDFWWYRFKNGQNDLDYDRSKDPETREFSEFPMVVLKKLVEKLGWNEKMVLRNVSKGLREVVENEKYEFEEFQLSVDRNDNWMISSQEHVNWGSWQQALRDFAIIKKWPKMKLDKFYIDFSINETNTRQVLEVFKSLDYQIPLKEVRISVPRVDGVLAVLPHLKPGSLEEINIFNEDDDHYINLNEVVKLDQWKQAKYCDLRRVELPIESLFHFCSIGMTVQKMTIDDVRKLKNVFLASPNFEFCYVVVDDEDDKEAILNAFEDEIIPIPETNQLFEIEITDQYWTPFTFSFEKTDA